MVIVGMDVINNPISTMIYIVANLLNLTWKYCCDCAAVIVSFNLIHCFNF